MSMRSLSMFLLLTCLGCHSLELVEPGGEAPAEASESDAPGSADLAAALWSRGQEAMRGGQIDRAIAFYEESLRADPSCTHNHLSLAAARLEKGEQDEACVQLARYIEAHPEHVSVRGHFAELLLRLKCLPEARLQFERCEADAQDLGAELIGQRIQCHSRLTRIAEAVEDEYEEHLHRGIGLYLLGTERAEMPDDERCDLSAESLLCKAAGELTLARLAGPDEARPCWYLYAVWSSLAQRQPAQRCLCEADDRALFSYLSPAEYRELQMARQRERKSRNF